jgi:hypothetical protein
LSGEGVPPSRLAPRWGGCYMLLAISQSVRSYLPQTPIGQGGVTQISLVHSIARRSPMRSLALRMRSLTQAGAASMIASKRRL